MQSYGELLEALAMLIDVARDARVEARKLGELNVIRELDRCAEAAMAARKWVMKEIKGVA